MSTRNFDTRRIFTATAALVLLVAISAAGKSESKSEYSFEYRALQESNIYHAYEDTAEVSSLLNVLDANASWKFGNRQFVHQLNVYGTFDLYSSYSQRNRGVVGVGYEPRYKYSKTGTFDFEANFSRRNKDLVDDAGQTLNRTLTKMDWDFNLTNTYEKKKFKCSQSVRWNKINYDETFVNAVRQASYDYTSTILALNMIWQPSKQSKWKLAFSSEGRAYDERKTYSVAFGATSGSPSAIRTFRENTVDLNWKYKASKKIELSLGSSWSRRTDNFENFYGFDQWHTDAGLDCKWSERNETSFSFGFKSKEFANYFNSRIATGTTVAVDYADFTFEHLFHVTSSMSFLAYANNYNKVSNDWTYDYHDLTSGIGLVLSY